MMSYLVRFFVVVSLTVAVIADGSISKSTNEDASGILGASSGDNMKPSDRKLQSVTKLFNISVHIHHVYPPAHANMTLTKKEIRDKYFSELNREFIATPFHFVLKNITITKSSQYGFCNFNTTENKMKQALKVPGKTVMNVYICSTDRSKEHSWGSYPIWSDTKPQFDGIVLTNYKSRAFNDTARWSYTRNIVHEAGHFLGLEHTFFNGCNRGLYRNDDGTFIRGDGVKDTPAHAQATSKEPGRESCWLSGPPLNTCPDNVAGVDSGPDPIKNHMNYMGAECRDNATFTPGQIKRMIVQHKTFRLDKICRTYKYTCVSDSQCCAGLLCKPDKHELINLSCQ